LDVLKDEALDRLARRWNVAQFVSFAPSLKQRFGRLREFAPNHKFPSVREAIHALLVASNSRSVNVRSFEGSYSRKREFVYGLRTLDEGYAVIERLAAQGLYTIVNETVDVHDGGVSGVLLGDVLEFAPDDTPRCVERPGAASLSRQVGLRLLRAVYGFRPALPPSRGNRIEFSLHPLRCGYRHEHCIVWERHAESKPRATPSFAWPNHFSRFLGDKAYGLLLASQIGLRVPRTLVVSRRIAPFSFGSTTLTGEHWIRTCPVEPMPGQFHTQRGWLDPFALIAKEDGDSPRIASILCQEGVSAKYSGAAIVSRGKAVRVEGVSGWGTEFMVGLAGPQRLPGRVYGEVRTAVRMAAERLGPVKAEWAFDGTCVWFLQLHLGGGPADGRIIFPGRPRTFRRFRVSRGIERLRTLAQRVNPAREGVILVGDVGVTSHFGDILRRGRIASRVEAPNGAAKPPRS
jgi:hypothetical protein